MIDRNSTTAEIAKYLNDIRTKSGMNRREFSEYFGIPLRTVEEWEAGRRKMPDYLLRLIEYKLRMEGII